MILRNGAAVLRTATPADDDLLVRLMPDDFDHDPTVPLRPGTTLAEHRERWLRSWLTAFRSPAPGDLFLPFVVETGDEPVGFQVLKAEGFERTRTVDSTSFLVPSARGRRLGVAMRRAILAHAFDVLGAERAVTAARPGNIASIRVSERVGYVNLGVRDHTVAGRPRPLVHFELTAERWRSLPHEEDPQPPEPEHPLVDKTPDR